MITNRLKAIFVLSIPVFIAHGLEEIYMGFFDIDSQVAFVFGKLAGLPEMKGIFILFQIMLWFTLIVSAFLIGNEKWRLRLMIIPGLIYIYEFYHFYRAIEIGGYYPGLVTAFLFPVVGYFYWKELLKNIRCRN